MVALVSLVAVLGKRWVVLAGRVAHWPPLEFLLIALIASATAWTPAHRIIDPQVAWKQTTMVEGGIFEKTTRLFGSMDFLVRFAFPGLAFPGLVLHPTLWPEGAYTLSIYGTSTSTAGFLFRQGF
jgi:hypothetical protein